MCEARRVLVVEDEPAVRLVLESALSDEGFTVRTAEHGRAALAALDRFAPCVILLDLRMPVLDGRGFLAAYRQRAGARSPIIVLSAEHQGARFPRRDGVAAIISKPFDLDDVLAQTATVARSHQPY